ncbi:hypothetical protein CF8_3492 [Nocardioides sp. CF8]|uniref:hypothetical protein n=1 Tax=Nocardioides sp. CF8 TaxID=110319 RepID=UPI0003302782|nr:hypothetical protein [Nocardioides sp. CF8]EON22636.1 hypothetical protein CF8_3492 [Nocardioides sp. CF8]
MVDTEDRPVLTGLIALVAVAAVIGIIGGLAALVGSKVLGLDGDTTASSAGSATSSGSLYLPEPTITSDTVVPESPASTTASPVDPSDANSKEIELSAGQQSVSAMQQIDLTGSYPTGEGAILQVQRLEDGSWEDFPVTASVNNQTFSTYVQTGQTGENTFRVIDTDKDLVSNEVVVTVG